MEVTEVTGRELVLQLEPLGVFWRYPGGNHVPHPVLTSGLHSDMYVNCRPITESPELLSDLTKMLVEKSKHAESGISKDDYVIGPAMGAKKVARKIAEHLGAKYRYAVRTSGGGGSSVWCVNDAIERGRKVLLVEDVITTGKTTEEVILHLQSLGLIVISEILCLVNRSRLRTLHNRNVIELISYPGPVFTPEACKKEGPCKKGSPAVRPDKNNHHLFEG